jgi:serine/threonine-protein kinase
MKILVILNILFLFVAGCGNKNSTNHITALQPSASDLAALNDVKVTLITQFNQFNNAMNMSALRLKSSGLSGNDAVNCLKGLNETLEFVNVAGTIDMQGRRLEIYPQGYFTEAGLSSTIPEVEKISEHIRRGEKHLSLMCSTKPGLNEVYYFVPVKDANNVVQGAVYIQIEITKMLRDIIEPQITGRQLNIWVLQRDGIILYDTSSNEIGLNVFKDKPFTDYPDLVKCAKEIVARESGTGMYSYITKGKEKLQRKRAQWNTFFCANRQWRIILNKEDRVFND